MSEKAHLVGLSDGGLIVHASGSKRMDVSGYHLPQVPVP